MKIPARRDLRKPLRVKHLRHAVN